MYSPIKEWLLRWLEPYREERASLMLEWRVFAQAHNAAGKWPPCAIGPYEKVMLVDMKEVEPDYLRDRATAEHEWQKGAAKRKLREIAGLPEEP